MNSSVRAVPSSKAGSGPSIKNGALLVLEEKLVREVDDEFFQESFRTLNRVIDVLGSQLLDRRRVVSSSEGELRNNPTYLALKKQQTIVEDAIEFIAVKHCADLNQSVVAVGKVARELDMAVDQVKNLRTQVKEIKVSLGTTALTNSGNPTTDNSQHHSLRELWLKKLECEAVLSLLNKLKILREAPSSFDQLIQPKTGYPCRIYAAVMLLRNAIDTMFNDDVAQIQALTKLSEQLMQRKQRAEEIVWDALHDVLYLRTAFKENDDENDVNDDGASSVASEEADESNNSRAFTTLNYNGNHPYRMIPLTVLKEEVHLEQKELQCLEEPAAINSNAYSQDISSPSGKAPKYTDDTAAFHVLIEALAGLGRLDDVERYLAESLPTEMRRIAEMTQGRTFAQLEKRRIRLLRSRQSGQGHGELQYPLRLHLKNLLSAFENVILRMAHLSQITRHRISSDPQVLTPSYETASSALQSIIVSADSLMQKEIKDFLKACLYPSEAPTSNKGNTSAILGAIDTSRDVHSHNREIFSLGIISEYPGAGQQQKTDSYGYGDTFSAKLRLSTASIMELSTDQFVTSVLLPRSSTDPQVRHALMFRSALARWSMEVSDLKRELAVITGQDKDTSRRSNNIISKEQGSLQFLDNVIQKKLLPLLQEEAVYSTTSSLERVDAFVPVFRNNIYLRSAEGEQPLCVACQVLLDATRPLFSALHRLPKGGDSYLSLVAVLEHALLAFVSRAKQRARTICAGKAADELLGEVGNVRNKSGLSVAVENRRAYSMLMRDYSSNLAGEDEHVASLVARGAGILPLAPPIADTKGKYGTTREKSSSSQSSHYSSNEQALEESTLQQELTNLQLLLRFQAHNFGDALTVCNDDELMNAACLGHSLLKLANLLAKRIKSKTIATEKSAGMTRQLREAVTSIRTHGQRMSKFCRIDVLVHSVKHMCKICKTYSLQTSEAARIPPCVNDVGEYLTNASDLLREAGGNSMAAYALSSLEQYIPLLLMESVRQIGKNDNRLTKSVISLKGVESLDRSGSVLYRDLKNATSFDGSFWDENAATDSFERAASYIALFEMDMVELEDYFLRNRNEFSDSDYSLIFSLNCPNRSGDVRKFYDLKAKVSSEAK